MSVNLTPQQRLTVECRGGSLIVSAAAGAGKTAVLVQRVLGLLTDPQSPCGVDELLVVTFTNAAAGEMRQRIGDRLRELLAADPGNNWLRRQLGLLSSARIQTVHAFCQSLLREHFSLCGIEPDFRLADETQCQLLKEQALQDTLEAAYEAGKPGFHALCDTLTDGRTDRVLEQAVLTMYERLRSHPYPEKLLALLPVLCAADPEGLFWMAELRKNAARLLEDALADLEQTLELAKTEEACAKGYGPALESDLLQGRALLAAISQGWDQGRSALSDIQNISLKPCKGVDKAFLERIKSGRARYQKALKTLKESYFYQNLSAIRAEGAQLAPMVEAICGLVSDFSLRYREEKRHRGLLDFSDLEHETLGLLLDAKGQPTDLARRLQAEFREVLVDEYQDTNDIQEKIFCALRAKGDSAFFVGDVKQSIYRFRLAEPELFLDRYKKSITFTGVENGDLKLSLNRNFRSRPEVLALCNAVFSRTMTEAFGDVEYDEEQRLYAGRETEGSVPSEVLLLDCPSEPDDDEQEARTVREAGLVARRVRRILREERVRDGDTDRPARPEDIAILLSSFTNKAPVFRAQLEKLGIPCGMGGGEFFGTVETSVMLSLLRVLNNRRQDIPLVSVLRSPLYFASPELLAEIRLLAPEGDLLDGLEQAAATHPLCARVLSDLDRWWESARELPLSRLVRLIYDETGAEGIFSALDGGLQRLRNLRRLEELCRPFDNAPYGLAAFLRWIDRKLQEDKPLEEPEGESGGVRLLSIHRSKGLEWPFVILPDLSKQFNEDDTKKSVLFHPHLGVGLRLRQQDTRAEFRTQLQQAIILRTRAESRAEELRKLYVAMTRAREKLILVMSDKDIRKRVQAVAEATGGAPTPQWLSQQRDAMSWLLAALLSHPGCRELRALCPDSIPVGDDSRAEDLICRVLEDTDDLEADSGRYRPADIPAKEREDAAYGPLLARSKAVYAHLPASRLPSKLTPTGLRELIPESGQVFGTPNRAAARDHHPQPLAQPDRQALQRGTAMHALLRRADLKRCTTLEGVLEQADLLAEKGYLNPEERALVWPEPIAAFACSELGRRTMEASRVLREYEFGVLLDAADLLEDGPAGEEILLNGAIDLLLFEDESMTIIDFKTDRVQPGREEAQAEEHALQLALYARAAEELFDLPVRERWVWFLRTGTGVSV